MMRLIAIVMLCAGIYSCQNSRPEKEKAISDTIPATSTVVDTPANATEPAPSLQKVDKVRDSLKKMGFIPHPDTPVEKLQHYEKHWFIKTLAPLFADSLPFYLKSYESLGLKADDTTKIDSIVYAKYSHSVHYPKNEDLFIERWYFANDEDAAYWLNIMQSLRRNEFTKPPREQWQEGNTLWVVMLRSADFSYKFEKKIVDLLKKNQEISG